MDDWLLVVGAMGEAGKHTVGVCYAHAPTDHARDANRRLSSRFRVTRTRQDVKSASPKCITITIHLQLHTDINICNPSYLSRKVQAATHNQYAWRFLDANGACCADNCDDGESGAGSKLAELLALMKVQDVRIRFGAAGTEESAGRSY